MKHTTPWLPLLVWAFAALLFTAPLQAQPIDEGPIDEGPIDEGPIDEGPIDEGPVDEGPVDEGPIGEGPVDEGPTDEGPVDEEPTDGGPVVDDPGQEDPNDEQPADTGLVMPKIVTAVAAVYPERAAQEKIEAVVVLSIDISATGEVEQIEVIDPMPPQGYGFEEAAREAMRQFVFEPARENGQPVPVRLSYRIRFKLAEPDPDTVEPSEQPQDLGPVGELRGRALERGTRDPLVGVLVTIFRDDDAQEEPIGFEVFTDEKGSFAFTDLKPGPWKIFIQPEGYFPYRTQEEINANELTEVIYFVEKGSYNPFDVLVEGDRIRKEVTKRSLSRQEIEKVPGTFGDPLNAVLNLPGVARPDAFSGEFIVRGSSSRDTRLYVSSMEVPIIYHFGGLRSVLPLGMIESIDFYPGNFSAYYGRATGGVLDVNLRELDPKQWHGYTDINLFDAGVFLQAPITDDLSIAVAARRSYIDFVIEAVVPDNTGINIIAAPAYYDWQILADWRPSLDHKLKVFVFGSSDTFRLLFDDPAEDIDAQNGDLNLSIETMRGILEYVWTPNTRLTSTTRIATGVDRLNFEALGLFTFNFDLYQPNARETLEYRVSDHMTVKTGLDVVWSRTDLTVDAPIETGNIDGGDDETGE
ncbi:MAG: TonB family protein, partial [Myxococcota bacterium]